jgi:hypothetical protein
MRVLLFAPGLLALVSSMSARSTPPIDISVKHDNR